MTLSDMKPTGSEMREREIKKRNNSRLGLAEINLTAGLISEAVFFITAATAALIAVSSTAFIFLSAGGNSPSIEPVLLTLGLFLSAEGLAAPNFLLPIGGLFPGSSTRPVDRNFELKVLTVLGLGASLSSSSVADVPSVEVAETSSTFLRGILANLTTGDMALIAAKVSLFFSACLASLI